MTFSEAHYRALVSGQARGLWPAIERGGLWLASVPYAWAVRLRNRFYDAGWKTRYRAPVPVVSVGNLTLGGTGKTPCVEYVAGLYRERGLRVALLSRGYASERGRNDEAMVLEENLPDVPHLQGADRVELARIAVEELDSEVLVLDDGFQHRRLGRDLDLVLVDVTNPWGHGAVFPRGLLREPRSGLRRANLIMLTRCDQVEIGELARVHAAVNRLAPGKAIVETTHRPAGLVNGAAVAELEVLGRRPVAAFCGIGNPEAFRQTLLALGADVQEFRVFPDHHAYTRADVGALGDWAARLAKDCVIVTTQKDLVKLRLARLADRPLWALRVRLHVRAGQETLDRMLWSVVRNTQPDAAGH